MRIREIMAAQLGGLKLQTMNSDDQAIARITRALVVGAVALALVISGSVIYDSRTSPPDICLDGHIALPGDGYDSSLECFPSRCVVMASGEATCPARNYR